MSAIVIDNINRTLKIGGYVFTSLYAGDSITVTFPNDNTAYTIGVNDTVLAKKMANADVCEFTINVVKYSRDDSFLNTEAEREYPQFLQGSLQTNFTRDGVDGVEVLDLTNITIKKKPDVTYNTVDGEETMAYGLHARKGKRII